MVTRLYCHTTNSLNPYHNLALEELLAKDIELEQAGLYLWQNADTVVIGKHQNAFSECDYQSMKEDSISLARRKTGGGAVFHDEKNLNFTFINRKEDYDLKRNQSIICKAMQEFGLNCEISGRNDITLNNKKFSGNAFFSSKEYCVHHGTIMLDVDLSRLEKYLKVDPSKLINKGVASVRSRVINLKTVVPNITVDGVKKALISAFEKSYGIKSKPYDEKRIDNQLQTLTALYASDDFILGKYPIILLRQRKEYGELMLAEINGKIKVFSDCLDVDIIEHINNKLIANQTVETKTVFTELQNQIITDFNKMLLEVR